MIGPTPPASNGPRKRKTSKGGKPSKAPKTSKAAKASMFPNGGKIMEAFVTPQDMERAAAMLRDRALLDWLDQCAGEIRLKKGLISLHFGGSHGSAREVLENATFSLRHLVFEAPQGG